MATPKDSESPEAPRPRGRPPAGEPLTSSITTWVPAALHDRLIELANRNGEHLSATIRSLLARNVAK